MTDTIWKIPLQTGKLYSTILLLSSTAPLLSEHAFLTQIRRITSFSLPFFYWFLLPQLPFGDSSCKNIEKRPKKCQLGDSHE